MRQRITNGSPRSGTESAPRWRSPRHGAGPAQNNFEPRPATVPRSWLSDQGVALCSGLRRRPDRTLQVKYFPNAEPSLIEPGSPRTGVHRRDPGGRAHSFWKIAATALVVAATPCAATTPNSSRWPRIALLEPMRSATSRSQIRYRIISACWGSLFAASAAACWVGASDRSQRLVTSRRPTSARAPDPIAPVATSAPGGNGRQAGVSLL
jgi:hypothetical protein